MVAIVMQHDCVSEERAMRLSHSSTYYQARVAWEESRAAKSAWIEHICMALSCTQYLAHFKSSRDITHVYMR